MGKKKKTLVGKHEDAVFVRKGGRGDKNTPPRRGESTGSVISGFGGEREREVSRATAAKLEKESERQGGRGSPEGTAGRSEKKGRKT